MKNNDAAVMLLESVWEVLLFVIVVPSATHSTEFTLSVAERAQGYG